MIIFSSFHQNLTDLTIRVPAGSWEKLLDSSSREWGGPGERAPLETASQGENVTLSMNPHSAVLYLKRREESR